jgi:putative spermidine/putrescine transport system ATP-binding protein
MARLELHGLSKRYGEVHAVRSVDLTVDQGEMVVLLGPSGCGKTTTLRMIAGFVDATSGRIVLGGEDITRLPPYRRNTGMVFQGYALFPHLTAAENVAFGLEMRKVAPTERRRRVDEALRLVRLEDLAHRLPRQLSGGQQQRVALARALVIEPDVLLLDEPLSNLDAKLRQEVRVEIRQLQRRLGITTVMVTHDQDEALTVADRLVVMSHGQVQQIGRQRDLYERPRNRFVAGFLGRTNFLPGRMEASGLFRTAGGLAIRCGEPSGSDRRLLAIRPEKIAIGAAPSAAGPNSHPGTVEFVSYLGAISEYQVRLATGETVIVQSANRATGDGDEIQLGQGVHLAWPAEACQLLDEEAPGVGSAPATDRGPS